MKKLNYLLVGLLLAVASPMFAQHTNCSYLVEDFENFSDGTFTTQNGWTSDRTSDPAWQGQPTNGGNFHSSGTGPFYDHTLGGATAGGTVVFMETSGGTTGNTATLTSPRLDLTSATNPFLDFHFFMYGANIDRLYIEVDTNGTPIKVDSIVGAQQNSQSAPWGFKSVDLSAFKGDDSVHVRFTGVNVACCSGDIALDDIEVRDVVTNDVSVTQYIKPVAGCNSTVQVEVQVANRGSNSVSSFDVEWQVNGGTTTTVSHSSTLAAGATANISLGTFSATAATLYDIKAWTKSPNAGTDNNTCNDTLDYQDFQLGLSGTYTVGGTSPDFATIIDAASALGNFGVCGPVIFDIRPGTYAGNVQLPPVPGASATNTVTFDGNDASTRTVEESAGATPVFDIVGADYITLKNLTVKHTGTIDVWGVHMRNESEHITIDSCNFELPVGSSFDFVSIVASNTYTSAVSAGNNSRYVTVTNCKINGGSKGIHLEGNNTSTPKSFGHVIMNNEMTNLDDGGVHGDDLDSVIIHNNILHVTGTGGAAIWLDDAGYIEVIANDMIGGSDGMWCGDLNFGGTKRVKIINNMIVAGNSEGIYLDDVRDADIWYNTVVGGGSRGTTSSAASGIHFDDHAGIDVRNNIFGTTSSNSHAFESDIQTGFTAIDNNVYYVPAGNNALIDWQGTLASLSAWKNAAGGFNIMSIEETPVFVSETDLHLIGCVGRDKADPSVGITVDIDGDPRPYVAATGYDIGADEIPGHGEDIILSEIIKPSICAGTNSVTITMLNAGCNDLTSATLNWSINGVTQSAMTFNGTLPSAGDTTFVVGTYTATVPNTYTFKVWSTNPNGLTDADVSNDTATIVVETGMAGSYTIGGTSPDYATFSAAAADLNAKGLCAAVVFDVRAGTYNEQIVLNEILGSSATNTITFEGNDASTRTITHNVNSEPVIDLNGADYVTVRNMTIEHTGTSDVWGVHLMNGADHNTIDSCELNMPIVTNPFDMIGIVASNSYTTATSEGNNASFLTATNNTFNGGSHGVRIEGNGTSGTPRAKGNTFINNTFIDNGSGGIYGDDQDSLIVIGNDMSQMNPNFGDGINIFDLGYAEIIGNHIIVNNGRGIYVEDVNFTGSNRAKFINNMVLSRSGREGMSIDDVRNADIWHNTSVGGTDNFSGYGIHFDDYQGVDCRNNIFGSLSESRAAFSCDQSTGFDSLNNNIYHVESGNVNLVDFNNTNYADLAALRTAVPQHNSNSREGKPLYVSADDLHARDTLALDAGDASVNILVDIDGDVRPLAGSAGVEIGADEYAPDSNDVGIVNIMMEGACGDSSHNVQVVLYNYSIKTHTGFPVNLDITGAATTTINATYNGSLMPFAHDTFNITTLNTYSGGQYNFSGYTAMVGDQNTENDSLTVDGFEVYQTPNPVLVGDTICAGDSTIVTATSTGYGNVNHKWYTSMTDTAEFFVGDTLATGQMSADETYYVQGRGLADPAFVETETFGWFPIGGVAFNVVALKDIVIDSLSSYVLSWGINSTGPMQIFYNETPISNNTLNTVLNAANGWNFVGSHDSVPGLSLSQFQTVMQPIPIPVNLRMKAGDTIALYLGDTTNLSAPDIELVTDQFPGFGLDFVGDGLSAHTGPGNAVAGSGSFLDRVNRFNGRIHYSTELCEGPRKPVTVVADQGAPSAGFTVTSVDAINFTFSNTNGGIRADYVWDFGDGNSSTDPNPTHTYATAGTYSVCLSTTNGCGSDQVCEDVTSTVGVAEVESLNAVEIYPNPSKGLFNVEFGQHFGGNVQLQIVDVKGQEIYNEDVENLQSNVKQIDLSEFSKGVYYIRMSTATDLVVKKLVIQ